MSPKQIIQAAFETNIFPDLLGRGFEFVPSRFSYKRGVESFIQEISITLSHRNTVTYATFWSHFTVNSPDYNRWRKQNGADKFKGALAGSIDSSVPGWRTEESFWSSANLSESGQLSAVLSGWLRRCLEVGLSYLDALSSWEGAATDLVRQRHHWERAADYYLIAGKPAEAVRALKSGIDALLQRDFSYSSNAHPILVAKKKRESAHRDAEVQTFRNRIAKIDGIKDRPLHE